MDRKHQNKKNSQSRMFWLRFKKNKLAVVGLVCILVILLFIIVGCLLGDYSYATTQDITMRYVYPSLKNGLNGLCGYDSLGRSVFWRLIYGGRITLVAALSVVILAMLIGGVIGAVCGFLGGAVDMAVMRVMDLLQCIPMVLMAMALVTMMGISITNLVIALVFTSVPSIARMLRASILTVRGQDYIEASRVSGASTLRIIFTHALPNALGPVIIMFTSQIAGRILSISSLSFIGLGVQLPTPEWGAMISEAKLVLRDFPYLTLIPGFMTVLSVLSVSLVGDGIRDAADPKLRR